MDIRKKVLGAGCIVPGAKKMVLGAVAAAALLGANRAEAGYTTTANLPGVGGTLANGVVYTVTENATLAASTGGNALSVAGGATTVLYIAPGVTLTCTGGNGSGRTAGGAGIFVPSNSKLIVVVGGTLNANGGNAASGLNGANGGNGSLSKSANWGTGGYGGAFGGGAGAGIGGGGGGAGGTFSRKSGYSYLRGACGNGGLSYRASAGTGGCHSAGGYDSWHGGYAGAAGSNGYHGGHGTLYKYSSASVTFVNGNSRTLDTTDGQLSEIAYTVDFDQAGGTGGASSMTVYLGLPYSVNVPTRADGIFRGYYTSTSGGTRVFDANGSCSRWDLIGDRTLYAQWDVVVTLAAGEGYAFAVSNLTTGAEIPAGEGGKYVLPVGAKVGIYAVAQPGYIVTGEPYVIDEVKSDTVIDPGKLPKAEKGTPAGDGAYVFAKDGNCTVFGDGVATARPDGFDRDSITSAAVADGVTGIGEGFFKDCRLLNEVTLGKDVAAVGEKAFDPCPSLERIVAKNPAVVERLKDAVAYQTEFDADHKPYVIPSISAPGYEEILYGANDLADKDGWQPVPAGTKMEESGYHFFKHVLQKVAE